jgi:tRNA A37 methylthiotransferase MiaB
MKTDGGSLLEIEKTPRVCIAYVVGCPRSAMDTAKLHEYFTRNGYVVTRKFHEADLVLCATCGVETCAEQTSIEHLAVVDKARRRHSKLIVFGCLAGINPEVINTRFDATLLPPIRLHELDEMIGAKVKLADIKDVNNIRPVLVKSLRTFGLLHRFNGASELARAAIRKAVTISGLRRVLVTFGCIHNVRRNLEPLDNIFSLRVAQGCMGECSSCAIRFAAGPLKSKPLDDILSEFDSGIHQGYKEFNIIAGDVGCYGQDNGVNITDLFRSMLSRQGDYRLTVFDFHPYWFCRYASELTKLFAANSKHISMLMLPVQSGSDKILRLMRRNYTAGQFIEKVGTLRKAYPEVLLSTHVLVGFPGETDEDFIETANLLRKLRFERVDVYKYSDRPGTESMSLPNKVPQNIINNRAAELSREFG